MLIEFTVGNFRSFKEPVTLSMVAAKIKARDPQINENNAVTLDDGMTLLTTASVFGPNGSGKSNLVNALHFMRQFVLSSSKETQTGELIDVVPYRLDEVTERQPSLFQVIFWFNNQQYRYGFEVSQKRVEAEWLFSVPSTKEAALFTRKNGEIKVRAKYKEGKGLELRTRDNALFLSVVAQFNGEIAQKILGWFNQVRPVSGLDDIAYRNFTISQFAQGAMRTEIVQFIKNLNLGILDIFHENIDKSKVILPVDMPDDLKSIFFKSMEGGLTAIKTVHKKWDSNGLPSLSTILDLDDESDGTQKIFFLSGPILDCLHYGRVLVIDEMEARLHPLMTRAILDLFNSPKTNPKHAQLIFTTHDTNLLSNKLFRRDQIWFLDKDRKGSSHLYSLAEIKNIRNDASFEKDYMDGRYGAIPFLNAIRQLEVEEMDQ